MDKRSAVCSYLKKNCRGSGQAVHSEELEQLFGISGRTMRAYVSRLRQDGYPICSDDTGYYYAENQEEINETVKRLNTFLSRVSNARTGLLYSSVIKTDSMTIHISIYE